MVNGMVMVARGKVLLPAGPTPVRLPHTPRVQPFHSRALVRGSRSPSA